MFNFLAKSAIDLFFGWRFWTSVGSFLVGRSRKRYNWPVEVCFLDLNYIILVSSTTISWSNSSVHHTVVLTKKDTSPADLL